MLNIIIYEDNDVFMKKNVEGVNRALVNCDIEYKIIKFSHYSDKLDDIINQKGTKKIFSWVFRPPPCRRKIPRARKKMSFLAERKNTTLSMNYLCQI